MMMSPNTVRLSMEEMAIVSLVSGLRRGESKTKGRQDNHGFSGENAWDIEIEGCAAEMAYCKMRGQYWNGSVCSFKEADCGQNVQVRHTTIKKGSLIVREADNDDHYYVLVTGRAPELTVAGWIKGSEAKKPEFRRAPNDREAAYFVPQTALRKFKQ